jgi:PAS domain S-box-containing protein
MLERGRVVGREHARQVLVIDDDQDFADSLSNLLTLEGYLIEKAYDAATADTALAHFRAEVALIDIRLGEGSGIELIAAFRHRRPDIICVMMTAYASVDTAVEALQEGAYDYLCKPFFTEDLLATLDRCFDRLTLTRERDAVEKTLRRRNQELEQSNARLHRVLQSIQVISGCQTLHQLKSTLLQEVVDNVAAAGGAIYLKQGARLVRRHAIGPGYPDTASGAKPDERAWRTAPSAGGDLPSLLALPLSGDVAQPGGLIALHAEDGQTFSPHDQELGLILTSFGCQAIRVFQALENLRWSEERLRRITENSPSAISLRDLEGRFVIVNRQFEAWHGIDGAGITGRTVDELLPPDAARCYAEHDRAVLLAGQAIDREVEMPFRDGTFHSVLMTTFPVLDGPGEAMGVGTIGTDVSAHKRAQEELRQAQKMEALGQLTGGVAHDFNNLLAVILGNLELMQDVVEDGSQLRELVEDALESARSGAELTHRLLAFGRRQTLHPQTTDLRELITDMSRLLERTLGETIEVVKILPDQLWNVEVDRSQVETSLLNLGLNARDAMAGGGMLTIEAANIDNHAWRTSRHDNLPPGRYVMIAVGDTGAGMAPEIVERAFQPFFTTKEVGHGSGLGLSMVYGFVKQSGGGVEITSEPGRGSTVRLYLPRARPGPGRVAGQQSPSARGQGETILVVEDRPEVRKLACKILLRLGYQVLEAHDGQSALTLLQDRPAIDLMLADVVLPGRISGVRLARDAIRRHPNLKILYISGYAAGMGADTYGADLGIRLIKKPFRRDELASIVRSTLDGALEPRPIAPSSVRT